ncbi:MULTISPECIES: ceramidase domain-containing protein [Chelatococcus]|uniref:Ceramidase n=1 Tax=Chelatococcus caeni TaxID=1348468 RepID=A0A840BX72_9HYPH|nr:MULTISPECIES: ceramidase domain-containing protein [Chelatococcus]ALA18837.1 hypothetical protein AL346_17300 [Chelatococcus sp. CO-6]MBB4016058.1 hypothetical protein [Chelatococcus caeni]
MDRSSWHQPIDAYCERIDPSFWSEPVNALTNGAFIIAAIAAAVLWLRAPRRDWLVAVLIVLAFAVGVGSFLFHTVATRWAALADVVPIALFIIVYFFLAMRRYLELPLWAALAVTVLFQAFSMTVPGLWLDFARARFGYDPLNGSAGYLPAAAAMIVVGILAWRGRPAVGRALVGIGGLFVVSLTFRSIDSLVCGALPLGTHFLWHLANALVLFLLLRVALRSQA